MLYSLVDIVELLTDLVQNQCTVYYRRFFSCDRSSLLIVDLNDQKDYSGVTEYSD